MFNKILVLIMLGFISSFLSCEQEHKSPAMTKEPIVQDMYSVDVSLPDSTGSSLFKTHCGTCHTLRYIQMQPELSRKAWEKITDKMIHAFGAPIPDSTATQIVNYLMAVRGKK